MSSQLSAGYRSSIPGVAIAILIGGISTGSVQPAHAQGGTASTPLARAHVYNPAGEVRVVPGSGQVRVEARFLHSPPFGQFSVNRDGDIGIIAIGVPWSEIRHHLVTQQHDVWIQNDGRWRPVPPGRMLRISPAPEAREVANQVVVSVPEGATVTIHQLAGSITVGRTGTSESVSGMDLELTVTNRSGQLAVIEVPPR